MAEQTDVPAPETVRANLRNAQQILRLAVAETELAAAPHLHIVRVADILDSMRAADERITLALKTLNSIMGEAEMAQRYWLVERLEREV
jgi:hypothetical protein